MKRAALAVGASLAIHAALVVGALGYAAVRGWWEAPRIDLQPITVTDVKELPLGPPPGGSPTPPRREEAVLAPRPRPPRARPARGTTPVAHADAGAPDAADAADAGGAPGVDAAAPSTGPAQTGDLRGYGPEGSRLTAILRLDRLRRSSEASAYIRAVDEILRLLPDRRRLLDGTGLDLYRDFDALLIATPNPFDDTVTFLAARHRLEDAAIKAALDRGASANGRPLVWRQEAGRPVAVRDRPEGAPAPRDDRLLLLPAPGLAIIAPPAYAKLLLEPSRPDGGAPAGRRDWRDLVARIDAEDTSIPEDAVFVMTATNLLQIASAARGGDPERQTANAPGKLPRVLSLSTGTEPSPFVEITADFAAEKDARGWEAEWPIWKNKLLANPLLMLSGLSPIVMRAELQREERRVLLRTTATSAETRRLLQMVVNLARSGAPRNP